MKRLMSAVVAAGVAMSVAGASYAAFDAAAAIKARQDGMKAQGAALKGMGQGLSGGASAADLKQFSAQLALKGSQLQGWFPKGSGPESGVKTKAKAEIWSDAAGFKAQVDNFKTQATKLDQAVDGGNMDAIKAQFALTRAGCKSCHEKYEVQD